ncbi:hypothetical protein pipiens_004442 [Culex pipiens pipiens]|uniref:Uncharacterized protein n=1 Tax=Culex pipiens pipiens TaxID=38569 RepID=A0ABD1CIV4_CULPP
MLCDPDDPALCGGQVKSPEVSGDPFSCADDVISEASVISVHSFEPRTEDRPVIALDSSDEEESCAVTLVSPSTAKRPVIEETNKDPTLSPVVQGELVAVNCYRQHFAGRHHFNLVGQDRAGEPVLMSFTSEENHFRVLLWLSSGTRYRLIPVGDLGPNPSPTALARQVCEQVTVERFRPVTSPADWRLFSRFEEEVEQTKFKFVVWTTNATTPRVNDVLSALVQRVTKREGIAVYTVFQDRDIKLRVTKMGNGETMQPLVAMIIQEETAALPPEHGNLHTVILVQPFGSNAYNVRVATRDEPLVQETFKQSDAMKVFILTELIKAEIASKAREVRMPLLRQLWNRTLLNPWDTHRLTRTSSRRRTGSQIVNLRSYVPFELFPNGRVLAVVVGAVGNPVETIYDNGVPELLLADLCYNHEKTETLLCQKVR